MPARILVTGGDGALGSSLLERLKDQGAFIRVFSLPGRPPVPEADETVFGDIRDSSAVLDAVKGMDVVIHMAALILGRESIAFHEVNVEGTKHVIDACKHHRVLRLVYVSSISVTYPFRNYYAESKWQAEQLVTQSGLNWTVLRPTLLVGKGGGTEYTLFASLATKPLLILPDGGNAHKRPVHVDDLATGIAQSLQESKTIGKIYAMAGQDVLSLRQMLFQIAKDKQRRTPFIIPVPSSLILKIVWIIQGFSKKLSIRQTLMSLTEDAVPSMEEAQTDFGFTPRPLAGRWLR